MEQQTFQQIHRKLLIDFLEDNNMPALAVIEQIDIHPNKDKYQIIDNLERLLLEKHYLVKILKRYLTAIRLIEKMELREDESLLLEAIKNECHLIRSFINILE